MFYRKLKDKSILESDDNTNIISSSIVNVNDKDSLQELCKRLTPRVLLHRLSPLMLSNKNVRSVQNDRMINSSNHVQITSYDMFIKNPSVRLERLLLTPTPSPEPNSDINTPVSTRNLNSCSNDSRVTRAKRRISEGIFPNSTRIKLSKVA
jgi:hypothetical protein